MRADLRRPLIWIAAGVVWLGSTAAGLAVLMDYDNRPGVAATAPLRWPEATALIRADDGPTLVMLAHPRCDCTRASVAELAEIMARSRPRPRAYVVFIRPGLVPGGWEQTTLWRQAAAIPGVQVVRDDRGQEARRFGVETSGQVLVFGANGALLFSGGTTGSRGKVGENAGRVQILAALSKQQPQTTTPVFGCSLFAPIDVEFERNAEEHAHVAR